ncbi:alpha/beta hydrolase [Kribbella sp. NPDC055071]
MTFEPAVRAHLEASDPTMFAGADLATKRILLTKDIDRMFTLFGLPGPEVHAIHDHRVAVDGGSILLRSYHPVATATSPAHVLIHGGGWTTGSIEELVADATARHRAVETGCVVILVEYRLAPEHPFPIPAYDVLAATRWVIDNAASLGVDPGVVTLGGASAGANLAAAAVIAAPELTLAALVLEVPALDLTGRTARAAIGDLGLDAEETELFIQVQDEFDRAAESYLGGAAATTPLASPYFFEDLARFPPTYVLTAGLDPLRAEGEEFVRRLRAAGVVASSTRYPGALHGSPILTATWPTARRWHQDILGILADVHQSSSQRMP